MKTSDLSKLYYLDKEIAKLEEDLRKTDFDILDLAERTGGRLSHTPRAKGGYDTTDRLVSLVDLKVKTEKSIHKNLAKAQQEKIKIEEFISGIEDAEIRYIIRLRHLDGLSWKEVADEVGRGNYMHHSAPRKRLERYLEEMSQMSPCNSRDNDL